MLDRLDPFGSTVRKVGLEHQTAILAPLELYVFSGTVAPGAFSIDEFDRHLNPCELLQEGASPGETAGGVACVDSLFRRRGCCVLRAETGASSCMYG